MSYATVCIPEMLREPTTNWFAWYRTNGRTTYQMTPHNPVSKGDEPTSATLIRSFAMYPGEESLSLAELAIRYPLVPTARAAVISPYLAPVEAKRRPAKRRPAIVDDVPSDPAEAPWVKPRRIDITEPPTWPFQERVRPWLLECFGPVIPFDKVERCDRFVEEALELIQACGSTAARAHALVDYVFSRPIGEPAQEVGGVMVTLAALCLAFDLDMDSAAETELVRIWTKVDAIRAKQASKPTGSALPTAVKPAPTLEQVRGAITCKVPVKTMDEVDRVIAKLRNIGFAIPGRRGKE